MLYGIVNINLVSLARVPGFVVNNFIVSSVADPSTERKLTHFWLKSWPDYGVPTTKKGRADPTATLAMLEVPCL